MLEGQEIHCHKCLRYVRFSIDTELDGNHVLRCPVCGHEHCRVVKNGKITDDRWDQRNGHTWQVTSAKTVSWTSASSTDYFLGSSWLTAATCA